MKVIPDHILGLMNPPDRQPLGKVGLTSGECSEKFLRKRERDHHNVFASWLRLNGIYFIHARTDRKSTIQVGWPDFSVMVGNQKILLVEFKLPEGRISPEQEKLFAELYNDGYPVLVFQMAAEAIEYVRKHRSTKT